MTSTRRKWCVRWVGYPQPEILGAHLPHNDQVLRVFFHYHKIEGKTVRESARLAIQEATKKWNSARIPVRQEIRAIELLEKLFHEWQALSNTAGHATKSKSKSHQEKVCAFEEKLKKLFDIAHGDAMQLIKNQEDEDFLECQRKGVGSMAGADMVLALEEKRTEKRKKEFEERKFKEQKRKETDLKSVAVAPEDDVVLSKDENKSDDFLPSSGRKHRKTKTDICIPLLSGTFDRRQASVRSSFQIVASTAQAFHVDLSNVNVSESTLYRRRKNHREKEASKIQNNFKPEVPYVVHWDGKVVSEIESGGLTENVKRLAVIVSGKGIGQLLGVPKLPSETGEQIAAAVYKCLQEWDLISKYLVGFGFDTTSSNSGRLNGACVLLEQLLKVALILYLACRHHIYELPPKNVYLVCLGPSSGPTVPLFERFRTAWKGIDQSKFQPGVNDPIIQDLLRDAKKQISDFAQEQLKEFQPRDDYKELLKLTLAYLGEVEEIHFAPPGNYSQARWVGKALYALLIFLFRGEFHLTARELEGLRQFTVFVVRFHIIPWFTARQAALAPATDLKFLQDLRKYYDVNRRVAEAAATKLLGLLWYLSEDLSVLSLFDPSLSPEVKERIVRNLQLKEGEEDPTKRLQMSEAQWKQEDFMTLSIEDFVTRNSLKTLDLLGISTDFLGVNPTVWYENESFLAAKDIVSHLAVVNDHAERGVKLMTDFANTITKDEEQRQFLLKAVAENRKKFPTGTSKADFLKNI